MWTHRKYIYSIQTRRPTIHQDRKYSTSYIYMYRKGKENIYDYIKVYNVN